MPTFLRRTTVEPGATLPQEITLPRGRIVGVSDGLGSVPALMIWQEVRGVSAIDENIPRDRYHLWVLRHGMRVPPTPVAADWAWSGVVVHYRQPAAVYLHWLGPAPEIRSTEEVLETPEETLAKAQRIVRDADARHRPLATDPFKVPDSEARTPDIYPGRGGW